MSENINKNTPACKLTEGGNIYTAGNAREFKTGDWRSMKPIFLSEKCKQCGLCFPVCPDDDNIYVEQMYWIPEDLVEQRVKEDKINAEVISVFPNKVRISVDNLEDFQVAPIR